MMKILIKTPKKVSKLVKDSILSTKKILIKDFKKRELGEITDNAAGNPPDVIVNIGFDLETISNLLFFIDNPPEFINVYYCPPAGEFKPALDLLLKIYSDSMEGPNADLSKFFFTWSHVELMKYLELCV